MERLNNAIRRSPARRFHQIGQRSPQNSSGNPPAPAPAPTQDNHYGRSQQPAPAHRPAGEQAAGTVQKQQYMRQATFQRPRQAQEAGELREHSPASLAGTPPGYSRQRPAAYFDQRNYSDYAAQEHLAATRELSAHVQPTYDVAASYPPTPQADVLHTWDDDDATSMRYGDWEHAADLPANVPTDYEDEDGPQTNYPQILHPSNRYGTAQADRRTYATRKLQDPSVQSANMQNLPVPQVRVQEVQDGAHRGRLTQPLDPRIVANMSQEQPRALQPSHARAVVPQLPQSVASPASRAACPICKGVGFLRADVPFGHPNFGKPIACDCKEAERREKRRQQLLELSDLNAFRNKNFKNFSTHFSGIHPSVIEAYQAAVRFAQNPNGWLIFIGPNGCGKTHLAAAIANESLNDGAVVLFSVVPELLDHLRAAFAPTAAEVYDQLFSKMREAGMLVLDDLGAQYSTPWASEKLYQLLNYRYSWRMPTVITTNNLGLQAVDARLSSRMMDSSLVVTINMERAMDCRPKLARRDL